MDYLEIFVPVHNFPRYVVSTAGRVKNVITNVFLQTYTDKKSQRISLVLINPETGRKRITLSRLVAIHFIPNPLEHPQVDHIDHNLANNNVYNLRWCTNQENNFNRGANREASSKYKGVVKRSKNRWIARIQKGDTATHIGSFKTEAEAGLAYNEYAKRLFGDFARLNVMETTTISQINLNTRLKT
jgi:hypothetical protein